MSYQKLSSSPDAHAKRVAILKHAHESVGQRRAEVVSILNGMGDKFALAIKFGRGVGRLTAKGQVFSEPESADTDEAVAATIVKGMTLADELRSDILGSVPGNKMIGKLIMPCGVCLIVGPGGVGKSPLAQMLARSSTDNFGIVRIGEPLSGYSSSEKQSATDIAFGMIDSSDLVVDSIKDLLAGGGAAMKSGISRESLTALSEWSSLACDMGTTLYVPVNPSSPDKEVLELLAEAARSNATSTLIYAGGSQWTYLGRTGEGLDRVKTTISFDANRLSVDNADVEAVSESRVGEVIIASVNNYHGALRRAIVSVKE
jgi:hypothetical protein